MKPSPSEQSNIEQIIKLAESHLVKGDFEKVRIAIDRIQEVSSTHPSIKELQQQLDMRQQELESTTVSTGQVYDDTLEALRSGDFSSAFDMLDQVHPGLKRNKSQAAVSEEKTDAAGDTQKFNQELVEATLVLQDPKKIVPRESIDLDQTIQQTEKEESIDLDQTIQQTEKEESIDLDQTIQQTEKGNDGWQGEETIPLAPNKPVTGDNKSIDSKK